MWVWGLTAICTLAIGGVAFAQYGRTRGMHRPLSHRQPQARAQDVPLGLEAIDMDTLSAANRRNESLERGQTNWLRKGGFFGRSDSDVAPWADNETYAARYHAAFQRKEPKDR